MCLHLFDQTGNEKRRLPDLTSWGCLDQRHCVHFGAGTLLSDLFSILTHFFIYFYQVVVIFVRHFQSLLEQSEAEINK